MSETYFTADHHFSHTNIIEFSKRPFSNIDEHDEELIDRWNSRVGKMDRVFHLGDFAMSKDRVRIKRIFERLNGQKFLIEGNHDKKATLDLRWSSVRQMNVIAVDGQELMLSHYALRTWPGIRRGTINLYGHSHGQLEGNTQACDVGVDCWAYMPVTLDEIKAKLETYPKLTFGVDSEGVFPPPASNDEITYSFALEPFEGNLHVFDYEMPIASNLVHVRFRHLDGILQAKAADIVELRKLLGVAHVETVVRHDSDAIAELEDLVAVIERRIQKLQGDTP